MYYNLLESYFMHNVEKVLFRIYFLFCSFFGSDVSFMGNEGMKEKN